MRTARSRADDNRERGAGSVSLVWSIVVLSGWMTFSGESVAATNIEVYLAESTETDQAAKERDWTRTRFVRLCSNSCKSSQLDAPARVEVQRDQTVDVSLQRRLGPASH